MKAKKEWGVIQWAADMSVGQWLALMLILGLAACDGFTIYSLFSDNDVDGLTAVTSALAVAICLEGIPYLMGGAASTLLDKGNYDRKERLMSVWCLLLGLLTMIFLFKFLVGIREDQITANGGYAYFKENKYIDGNQNGKYLLHRLQQVLPIFTSITAFLISWKMFPSDSVGKQARITEKARVLWENRQKEFYAIRDQIDVQRSELWSSLSEGATMPDGFGDFRRECFARIRAKLSGNCMSLFPSQLDTYHDFAEAKLQSYIEALNARCGIHLSLTVEDVLKQYDEENQARWDKEKAAKELENDLRNIMDNAIKVAQFQTITHPYSRKP